MSTSPTVNDSRGTPREDPNPAGNAVFIVIAATVLVVAAIAAYVLLNEHPPLAVGEVTHLTAFPVHSVMKTGGTLPGSPGEEETNDQVILLVQVKIHNQSKVPLFVHDLWANLALPDQERRSLAASTIDFPKVFIVYPQLASIRTDPVLRGATLNPGQTIEGMMIFNYPVSKDEWDRRKSLDVVVSFTHQKNLVIRAPQ